MVKVFTGRVDCVCMSATTVEESTPPERKAPKGTSAIICPAVLCMSSRASSRSASALVPLKISLVPTSATSRADQ